MQGFKEHVKAVMGMQGRAKNNQVNELKDEEVKNPMHINEDQEPEESDNPMHR